MRKHEVLGLCGLSGSGKTTLLRIICGLCRFEAGRVVIGATEVRARAPYPPGLYGTVGLVFQEASLFPHMTVVGNVTLALREFRRLPRREAHERGMAELERMGVAPLAQRYPSTLSGGEKQRVAIARAMAVDPLLLLLDEPTSHLDRARMDEVRERVLELRDAGTTMLIVTHNMDFVRETASKFAVLHNGRCNFSTDPTILNCFQHFRK